MFTTQNFFNPKIRSTPSSFESLNTPKQFLTFFNSLQICFSQNSSKFLTFNGIKAIVAAYVAHNPNIEEDILCREIPGSTPTMVRSIKKELGSRRKRHVPKKFNIQFGVNTPFSFEMLENKIAEYSNRIKSLKTLLLSLEIIYANGQERYSMANGVKALLIAYSIEYPLESSNDFANTILTAFDSAYNFDPERFYQDHGLHTKKMRAEARIQDICLNRRSVSFAALKSTLHSLTEVLEASKIFFNSIVVRYSLESQSTQSFSGTMGVMAAYLMRFYREEPSLIQKTLCDIGIDNKTQNFLQTPCYELDSYEKRCGKTWTISRVITHGISFRELRTVLANYQNSLEIQQPSSLPKMLSAQLSPSEHEDRSRRGMRIGSILNR